MGTFLGTLTGPEFGRLPYVVRQHFEMMVPARWLRDGPVAHRVKIAMPGHELEDLVFVHIDPRLVKRIIPVSGHAHRNLEALLLDPS